MLTRGRNYFEKRQIYSNRGREAGNVRIADSFALVVLTPQGSRSRVAVVALSGHRNS